MTFVIIFSHVASENMHLNRFIFTSPSRLPAHDICHLLSVDWLDISSIFTCESADLHFKQASTTFYIFAVFVEILIVL